MAAEHRNCKQRRIALLLEYDGTPFCGWQIQKEGYTIQGEINRALKILTREEINIVGSGRTDTGVHAKAQVAHFDLESDIPLRRIGIGLNGIMDKHIAIKNVYHVGPDFHARYDAVEREYQYLIYNHPLKSPFMQYRALWVPQKVDLGYIRELVSYLIGEKDFAAFCKKQSADKTTIRDLRSIRVEKRDEWITLTITADSFLHNMIRIIVGTITDFIKNNEDPARIEDILAAGTREAGGMTAPPFGLYLNRISYSPALDHYESAF